MLDQTVPLREYKQYLILIPYIYVHDDVISLIYVHCKLISGEKGADNIRLVFFLLPFILDRRINMKLFCFPL